MNDSGGVSPNNRFNHKLCPLCAGSNKADTSADIALSAHQSQFVDASHGHNAGDINNGSLSESRFDRFESHQVPPSSCSCSSPPYPLRRVFTKTMISRALAAADNNCADAARQLDISRQKPYAKLSALGIE
jgi:DNA-binding NtrC family response regulator